MLWKKLITLPCYAVVKLIKIREKLKVNDALTYVKLGVERGSR